MKYSITPAFKRQLTTYISCYHYPATKLGDDLGYGTSYINQLLKDRTKSISHDRLEQISEAIAKKAVEYKTGVHSENHAADIEDTKQEILSALIQTVHPDYIVDSLGQDIATLDSSLYITNVSPQTNFQLTDTVQKLITKSVELSVSEQMKKLELQLSDLNRQTEITQKKIEAEMKRIEKLPKIPSLNTPSATLKIVKNTLEQLPDKERRSFCSDLSDLIKEYNN